MQKDDTIFNSGAASARMKTDSVTIPLGGLGTILIPGVVSLGDISLDFATFSPKISGYAYTDRPDSFAFAYKYSSGGTIANADTGNIILTLTNWSNIDGRTVVAQSINRVSDLANFITKKVKIPYQSALTPDTLLIQGTSSGFTGIKGSTLWLDDIAVSGLDTAFKAFLTPKGTLKGCVGDTVRLKTDNIAGNTFAWYNGATLISTAITNKFAATTAGTYYVVVTTPQGAYTSDTATIVFNAKPTVTLTGNQDTICKNAPVLTLTGGSPVGGQYSGGAPVANGKFTAANAANGNNTIRYTFQDANGCSASATEIIFVKVCVNDIEILQADLHLSIYPNPASTQLFVRGDEKMIGGEMQIVDITGRLISKEKITNSNFTVDVKNFPIGFYAVRFTNATNETIANGKFTIAK